jgi:MFS transporter, putative metabolite:H+ symporter
MGDDNYQLAHHIGESVMAIAKENEAAAILARLDRIPIWPYPRSVLLTVGFGFFFAFFDVVTIGFALPVVARQFNVSSEFATWAITGSLLGYIVGSILDSRISDRFGRRLGLVISVSLFTVGSLLSAASTGMWWLIAWRVVSGMGIGAEISSVSTYLGELSPAPRRGRYTAWAIAAGMLGFAVVPFIALALVPRFDWGWRLLFVIGGLGGLVIGVMRRDLPHSAHWLLNRNRGPEAETVVEEAEILATKRLGRELPPPGSGAGEPPIGHGALGDLLKPPYLRRLVLITVIWFIYYIGNYAWLTLAPTLFVKLGYSLTHSIYFMVLTGIGFVVGATVAALVSDLVERKVTIAITCIVWAAALFVIGCMPSDIIIMTCGFIASTTIGLLIPLLYTYTAENFPTGIRATGVSATDGIGHLGGALAPIIMLAIFRHWDFAITFYAMAATGLITAILLILGVRTTGKPLTEIALQ